MHKIKEGGGHNNMMHNKSPAAGYCAEGKCRYCGGPMLHCTPALYLVKGDVEGRLSLKQHKLQEQRVLG